MSKLLRIKMIGRLGNLMFIFAHAKAWCEQNGYELMVEPWIGERIFNIPPAVRPERGITPDLVWEENTRQNQDSLIYTRAQVRQWFQWRPEILERLQDVDCIKPVVLNVREASDCPWRISRECYIEAATFDWDYKNSDCEFETDLCPTRLDSFNGDPSAAGLGTTMVSVPSFYRLTKAKVLFRAASTFAWWAATLSDAKVYSPIIRGLPPGHCHTEFVEGNWPLMSDCPPNTDLHLKD